MYCVTISQSSAVSVLIKNKAKWHNELFVDDIINLLGDGVQAFQQWL